MTNQMLWPGVLLVLLAAGCKPANEPQQAVAGRGFVPYTYRDSFGSESKFIVFVPESYDARVPCPTILFLHGSGQTGRDGEVQAQGGLGDAIRKRQKDFPFLTIFPQSHEGSWRADSRDGQRALAILETVERLYNVDRRRVYLTGYSMGGEGSWSLAGARPDLFAAVVPLCAGKNIKAVAKLKDMPCWCFQGDADAQALVQDTRWMMLALKKAGGRPIYDEYPGVEHNCWDRAYDDDELYEWLLQQGRIEN